MLTCTRPPLSFSPFSFLYHFFIPSLLSLLPPSIPRQLSTQLHSLLAVPHSQLQLNQEQRANWWQGEKTVERVWEEWREVVDRWCKRGESSRQNKWKQRCWGKEWGEEEKEWQWIERKKQKRGERHRDGEVEIVLKYSLFENIENKTPTTWTWVLEKNKTLWINVMSYESS